MATYVLVHGAWAGGWCWSRVAKPLRAAGHDVFTPTLTAQGERAHLFNPEVGLDTHVRDVVGVLDYEELDGVILVGHSYGGMVITAAAEEASSRLARLVYVDAFVPGDGQSAFDFFPPELREAFRAKAQEQGDGWRIPGDDSLLDLWGVSEPADRRWVGAKLTPFPLRCFEQPVKLPANAASKLPRTYVDSTGSISQIFARFAEQARREGWDCHEVAATHVAWLTKAEEIAEILLALPEARQ